jgi:hypothetical protein
MQARPRTAFLPSFASPGEASGKERSHWDFAGSDAERVTALERERQFLMMSYGRSKRVGWPPKRRSDRAPDQGFASSGPVPRPR